MRTVVFANLVAVVYLPQVAKVQVLLCRDKAELDYVTGSVDERIARDFCSTDLAKLRSWAYPKKWTVERVSFG